VGTEQLAAVLAAISVVTGLTATLFAFRADAASRGARKEAARRWDDMVRPRPHFTFVSPPLTGQPIEVEVENLGGTLAAGAVVAAYGEQLFASELTLPDKAPAAHPPAVRGQGVAAGPAAGPAARGGAGRQRPVVGLPGRHEGHQGSPPLDRRPSEGDAAPGRGQLPRAERVPLPASWGGQEGALNQPFPPHPVARPGGGVRPASPPG